MTADVGRTAFVFAVLVVLGWFAIGTHVNVRRGHALLRWLEGGLSVLGPRTTLRWLGSSAIELKVQGVLPPLRTAEVVIALEPRDLPLLWWFFHARGRRDLLIVRGELGTTPLGELEALDREAWTARGVERTVRERRWAPLALPPDIPLVAYVNGRSDAAIPGLRLALFPGLGLVRLGVRQRAPQVELQWTLASPERPDARRVFEAVHELAGRVSARS